MKKNKNRRILYEYHNLSELSERALRNLDGAMDNAHDVAVMRYVKQELLDDLQRLLKCPKPKTECADRALLDGALNGWRDEAYDLKRELKNGDPTDAKWLERPIKVEMLPRGLDHLCLDNFGQYAQKYYNAAITFRRLMYTLIYYHAQSNPTNKDRNAYELALREMEEIWVPYNERSNND